MTTGFFYGLFCLGFIGLMCLWEHWREQNKLNERLAVSQENRRAQLRYKAQLQGERRWKP